MEDLNHELEATRATARESEKHKRKFDQQQAEYRTNLSNAISERDVLEQGMRDQESKILSLGNEIGDLQQRLDEAERTKRFLQQELDEQVNTLLITQLDLFTFFSCQAKTTLERAFMSWSTPIANLWPKTPI